MIPDSPEQWGAWFYFAGIIGAVVIVMWTRWDYKADESIRGHYAAANVAYDDDAKAADDAAWAEWDAILLAVDNTAHAEPTPIFSRTVLDDIYRRTGGGDAA